MILEKLKAQLIIHEGERLRPYRCPAGKLTIGVGRNMEDNGISHQESMILLNNDIDNVMADLHGIFPFLPDLPENVQLVLADMRFNLGPGRFRGFRRMIAAVIERDWSKMLVEMIDSAWFRQVGQRGVNLVRMIDEVINNGNVGS